MMKLCLCGKDIVNGKKFKTMKKEVYILKASNKTFVRSFTENEIESELVITSDPTKAKQFERCGDVMIEAVNINDIFEKDIFKVERYYD